MSKVLFGRDKWTIKGRPTINAFRNVEIARCVLVEGSDAGKMESIKLSKYLCNVIYDFQVVFATEVGIQAFPEQSISWNIFHEHIWCSEGVVVGSLVAINLRDWDRAVCLYKGHGSDLAFHC